ncbi:hypothetical protein CVT26_013578 [Gymnopilus dilepis]|uniref:Heterokaryon incompatibility domain-containing protein n=1 Tax=Gymnopilus dilepis TaxID=231916 RepID=A0A409Y5R5_9AGAR|nr:hypothetical protein CVT26_013578 [Gymnopilus dilepis]
MSDERNASAKPHVVCDRCRGTISTIQEHFKDFSKGDQSKASPPFRINHDTVPSSLRERCIQAIWVFHCLDDELQSERSKVVATADAWLKGANGERLINGTLFIESDVSKVPVEASWSISTSSDAMLDLAGAWLNDCTSDHHLCEEIRLTPASNNISPFPTFLVDVGAERPCLRRTADLPSRPRYFTLSHRWGGSHIFQLKNANLATLLTGFDLANLPKTFRDAIFITRRLGYQYLWIDSLCIIQDSKEHWQTESTIMGDIYRGSMCTIAALGATDGDSGCFKTRNPLCFEACRFELAKDYTVQLAAGRVKKQLSLTGYGPSVEPLHERAWVMQEWMLSPRTLHFGTFGLYWECVSGSANDHDPKLWKNPTPQFTIHQTCSMDITGKFDESYIAFWRWWVRVISSYNPCGLTYGTDKLVAIAGLVKLVESKTRLHNIAGLWREFIFPELLWYTGEPRQRPTGGYQAPTWSWACLNCEVAPGLQDFSYTFDWKIELLEAAAQDVAANGQISGAHIRVRGLLQPVKWEEVENGYKLRMGDKIPEENSPDDGVMFMPDVLPGASQELWALLVVHASSSTAWMNIGLVVAKESTSNQRWVRVGSFRQYDWAENTTSFFQAGGAEITELLIV